MLAMPLLRIWHAMFVFLAIAAEQVCWVGVYWFEARGPRLTLVVAGDDYTSLK